MKRYPTERKRPIGPEFKDRVRNRLEQLGRSHRWLEQQIGASRGMVSKMLAPDQNTSALVDRVCKALDLDPPAVEARTDDELELVMLFRRMTPEQRRHLLGLLQRDEPS